MARVFSMDPVTVLDADRDVYEIRLAAAVAAVRQMDKEASDGR